jgi:hypothetical protein
LRSEHIDPPNEYTTGLGRTINVVTGLTNDGMIDISSSSNIYLKTSVIRVNSITGVKDSLIYTSEKYPVEFGSINKDEVSIRWIDPVTKE